MFMQCSADTKWICVFFLRLNHAQQCSNSQSITTVSFDTCKNSNLDFRFSTNDGNEENKGGRKKDEEKTTANKLMDYVCWNKTIRYFICSKHLSSLLNLSLSLWTLKIHVKKTSNCLTWNCLVFGFSITRFANQFNIKTIAFGSSETGKVVESLVFSHKTKYTHTEWRINRVLWDWIAGWFRVFWQQKIDLIYVYVLFFLQNFHYNCTTKYNDWLTNRLYDYCCSYHCSIHISVLIAHESCGTMMEDHFLEFPLI